MRLARIVCCMDDGRELALWHFGGSEQDEHCHESSSSNIRDNTNVMVDIQMPTLASYGRPRHLWLCVAG